MKCLKSANFFVLPLMLNIATSPVLAADTVSSQSSTTQQTTETGDPTIIQHIDSKMEPIAVQSQEKTDPATGAKSTVVQPIIMERHDKVLDTTIIQPQVTETKTVTEDVVKAKQPATVHKAVVKSHVVSHKPRKHYIVRKHRATATATKPMESSRVRVVETVTRQEAIKETTIKASPTDNPPPAPQVIQKEEHTN
jgi:hypothetical protein